MGPTQGGQTEKAMAIVPQEAPLAAERGGDEASFGGVRGEVVDVHWALESPLTGPARRAGGKRGRRLSQTQAGSELPLGRQRGRARSPARCSPARCFPAAALVASFAAPGGFLWLPRRGQLVLGWEGWPCWGLGGKREGQPPRKQRPGEGARPGAPPFPLPSPAAAPLHFLRLLALQASPPPGQASAGERRGQRWGLGGTPPAPSPPLSQPVPPPCTSNPRPATHPTHSTASTSPHTDERTENKELPVDQPCPRDAE